VTGDEHGRHEKPGAMLIGQARPCISRCLCCRRCRLLISNDPERSRGVRHDGIACSLRRDSSRSFGMTRLTAGNLSFRAPARNPGPVAALAPMSLAVSLAAGHQVRGVTWRSLEDDVCTTNIPVIPNPSTEFTPSAVEELRTNSHDETSTQSGLLPISLTCSRRKKIRVDWQIFASRLGSFTTSAMVALNAASSRHLSFVTHRAPSSRRISRPASDNRGWCRSQDPRQPDRVERLPLYENARSLS
jgi:hypothetical protein